MAAQPNTVDLLRRTVGALTRLASMGGDRSVQVGTGPARMNARLERIDIEPSALWTTLDPTSSDHALGAGWKLPGSAAELASADFVIDGLLAPWRGGAQAAVQATNAVTRALEGAASGLFEMATAVHLSLRDVRGATWSANRISIASGPVVVRPGLEADVRCASIRLDVHLDREDLATAAADLPLEEVRLEDGELLVHRSGRWSGLALKVEPRVRSGRVAIEGRAVRRGRWSLPLPDALVRRMTWWVDPPDWLDLGTVVVERDAVVVTGSVEEWAESVSIETVQKLLRAVRDQEGDLVLPRASASRAAID